MIRLQKILAGAGVASRRKAEEMIIEGRVAVNGIIVRELGAQATHDDEVTVDGVPIREEEKRYIALHKPEGVVTTASDQFGRATVMDFAPTDVRFFPVGRLDYDTSGLIFLTNDGDWANNLMHPKNEIVKTYIATLNGEPSEAALQAFRNGLKIDDRLTAPAKIKIIHRKPETVAEIKIHEGRNRQIRKMCDAIGHGVLSLKRVAIGSIRLANLPVGKWRELNDKEINSELF